MTLVFAPDNEDLVDCIWKDQPAKSANLIVQHPLSLAGQPASEKLSNLRAEATRQSASAYLASDLSEIAWLCVKTVL